MNASAQTLPQAVMDCLSRGRRLDLSEAVYFMDEDVERAIRAVLAEAADSIVVPRDLFERARAELQDLAIDVGDDHSTGICSCELQDLVHHLDVLAGDPDAIEADRRQEEFEADALNASGHPK